jgi:hypothetical protein
VTVTSAVPQAMFRGLLPNCQVCIETRRIECAPNSVCLLLIKCLLQALQYKVIVYGRTKSGALVTGNNHMMFTTLAE